MTTDRSPARARAIRRFRWIGLLVPLGVFVVLAGAQAALLPLLPDPLATHWGLAGGPDGFLPAAVVPVLTLAVGGGVTALLGGIGLAQMRSARGRTHRLLAAVAWFETAVLSAVLFGSTLLQVGLDDARDAGSVTWLVVGGFAAGIVLGAAAWALVPDLPDEGPDAETPAPLHLAPGERAVWMQTVTMARTGLIALVGALVLLVAVSAGTAIADVATAGAPSTVTWITIGCAVLVAALVATTVVYRVRVDDAGLTVRAPIGWPRVRIPRAEIASAEVAYVDPMGEYGGWGWRYGMSSGWGVVMRAGEALRVTRTNGRVFTVTIDDAATAAALLAGLGERTDRA
ncbi:DUF1648 domain-containing protein [Microbacterium gilvum]|uniref:DUF1648 domain-containing protein n=1 Tax=Microbacterium gilvum TaxID=1336204 RepID=A0ABP8ZWL8_9MICO